MKLKSLKKAFKRLPYPQIALALFLTSLLLGIYYFAFLKPRLEVPRSLLTTEGILIDHKLTLLQNRAAFFEYKRLNPLTPKLALQRERIIESIKATNEEGLKKLEEEKRAVPEIEGVDKEKVESLLARTKENYTLQKELIDDMETIDALLQNIYLYDATIDLYPLDLANDKEALIERTSSAESGLSSISENLRNYEHETAEIEELANSIDAVGGIFTDFRESLEVNNYPEADSLRQEINEEFLSLRDDALLAEISILTTEPFVKAITQETNLILEYDFWLDKIDEMQAEISY